MRRHYLDNIRWITILTVVVYHVFLKYSAVVPGMGRPFYEVQYQDGLMYFLYPWFMIILFIISGMSSRYYLENHSINEFVKSRTLKLLVPSTIGVLVAGYPEGYFNVAYSGGLEQIQSTLPAPIVFLIILASGIGVKWFIQMLWLYSLLLAIIRRFEKGTIYDFTKKTNVYVLILLVIPVWLSGQILNTPVIVVYRFGIYTLAFFLGYFVFAHDEVIDRLSRCRAVLIPLALGLGIVYLILHFGDNYADMPVVGSVPAVAFAWAAILAIFGSARAWADKTGTLSSYMTKSSWGIYIFHNMIISGMALLFRDHTSLPALLCYVLTFVAGLGGAIVLNEIISRIPIVRWCVLGIKKKCQNV